MSDVELVAPSSSLNQDSREDFAVRNTLAVDICLSSTQKRREEIERNNPKT